MEIFAQCVRVLMSIMSAWLLILVIWQLIVGLFGYKRKTKQYRDFDPEMRFLVLVPAHNEEAVISDIIHNLSHMDYPKELYDFYILADNCTDRTAEVARSLGANVLEFFKDSPDAPTGKPIALQKALNALEGYQDKYDLVMFFDADNLMDANMFTEVNSQYLDADKQADVIQCYLGSKNIKGIVPLFYYMSFTITNRFFQFARSQMGLNSGIGGTGFAVSTRYLHERGGWTVMSLTEDLELQVAATCEGRRVLWNQNVRIYDEKPTTFRASYRQRLRWAQGQWFVAFKNTGKLCRALLKGRVSVLEFLSSFFYLYSLTPPAFLLIQTFLSVLLEVFGLLGWIEPAVASQNAMASWLTINLPGIAVFLYSFIFLFYVGDWMDNHKRPNFKQLPFMIVSMSVNLFVGSLAQGIGLLKYKQQHNWVKTEHSLNQNTETAVKFSDMGVSQ